MHGTSQSERFIFTVSTGRCGQASLANLLAIHAPYCYAAFEEPQVRPILPGPLRPIERRFRRRFVETHELLGRGRVLHAFDRGDQEFIDRIVARRLKLIRRTMERRRAHVYFDVSKFFARGLHAGFCKAIGRHALVNLVRDPVQNMRSYLNRNKNFFLDNNSPAAASNILRLEGISHSKGELYLWAWFEMNLRFHAMKSRPEVSAAVEIRTERLGDAAYMSRAWGSLGLDCARFEPQPALNTNVQNGFVETHVSFDDVRTFERFAERVPRELRDRISYLRGYDPWRSNGLSSATDAVGISAAAPNEPSLPTTRIHARRGHVNAAGFARGGPH
jgi:hypothetical protein